MSGRFPGVYENDHGRLSPSIQSSYLDFNPKPQERGALRNIPQHQAFQAKVQGISMHTMKTYGGVNVQLQTFLASALNGSEWSASRPRHFIPGKDTPAPNE